MANLILPDSNVYIDAARAREDPFKQLAAFVDEWEFATCGMVVLEVCRGIRDPVARNRFLDRFSVMIYVPTSNSIWERATQLAWALDRKGIVLPASDLVIAACALQANAAVLTADAHFSAIPGLRVLDRLA